jgi:hypothetical protein
VSDEPQPPASRESPRPIKRQPDAPQTGIIRREPTGGFPAIRDDSTGIIRREPTGGFAAIRDDKTGIIRQPRVAPGFLSASGASGASGGAGAASIADASTSIAAAAVSVVSGWATAVIATDLITGWWHTDRLFCLAVGFLATVFAVSTVAGLILLLLRRGIGRWLIICGAVVALLTFAGIFIAGANVPRLAYAVPVLPVTSVVLALLPSTRRWSHQI